MSVPNRKDEEHHPKNDASEGRSPKEHPGKKVVVKSSSDVQMPKALSPPTSGPQHTAWSHLEHLYRISKILAELTNVEQSVAETLAVLTNIQPLNSAVLIHKQDGGIQTIVWSSDGVSEPKRLAARKHATASYEYFAGITATLALGPTVVDEATPGPQLRSEEKNFIAIPLVVGRQAIFGVLQLEGPAPFTESGLIFLNAIANQLAVALDRHYASQRAAMARAQIEEAERRMRFLAEAGKILASSLDHQATWESLVQLATCHSTDLCIADLCIIDIPERDHSGPQRTTVLASSLTEQAEKELLNALAEVMSTVLQTGRSVIYPEVAAITGENLLPHDDASVHDVPPLKSYMCVPLELEGTNIGTLTVGWATSGHAYSAPDMALLHDLVLRVVLAFVRARLYRSAVAAIRSRDDLLSIVSHDLRAPLAVIMGFTNIFLRNAGPGEPVNCDLKHLEAIQRSATQMRRLIEDLLSTASIEANHVLIERQLNPVEPLIREAVELMEPLATRKGIQILTDVADADHIPPIFVDSERTMQVFANLIGNAIKFSASGSSIKVSAAPLGNSVQFSVEDSGPGIPQDQLAHIFDRFWQVRRTASKGHGLGLFIVRGIVEAHGGTVWAESKVGVGTTVFFTLPVSGLPPILRPV